MVTVSHLVEKIVEKKPFLEEALAKGIINYAALAEILQPDIENELKIKVKTSAVMMALRRFSEKLEKTFVGQAPIKFKESDLTIRSDLFEVTVHKSPFIDIRKLYDLVDFSKGDFLTVTQGLYEVTIIASKKYKLKILRFLEKERIVKTVDNLSSLTVKIPIEALETAGLFYVITKSLTWENINIVEIVSTLTEMTFILREDDVSRAFDTLKRIIEQH